MIRRSALGVVLGAAMVAGVACGSGTGGGGQGGAGGQGNFGGFGNFGGTGGGGVGNTGGFGNTGNTGGFGNTGNTGNTGGFGNTGNTGGVGNAAGTGGTGGSGGNVNLGRACTTNAECGSGLTCMLASSGALDGGGPAKGLCTAQCIDDSDCTLIKPSGVCVQYSDTGPSYCFEGCTFGNPGSTFLPSKCHGRQEMACSPLSNDGATLLGQACLPQCNGNTDCGSLFCDPSSGLCVGSSPTGLPLGSECVQQDGGSSQCKGNCTGIISSGSTPFTYTCTEKCTLGAVPQCGWAGQGTVAPGFCLFSSTLIPSTPGAGIGDAGSCAQLCNCNADCLDQAFVCIGFAGTGLETLEAATFKKGYCGAAGGSGVTTCN